MNGWLDKLIVGVLVLWALGYLVRATARKFKKPGCGDGCACGAKKTARTISRNNSKRPRGRS